MRRTTKFVQGNTFALVPENIAKNPQPYFEGTTFYTKKVADLYSIASEPYFNAWATDGNNRADIQQLSRSLYVLMAEENTTTGCTAILFPKMKSRIQNYIMDRDFYLLLSSIHEWLIVPMGYAPSVDALEDVVKSCNADRNIVSQNEILSDGVYTLSDSGELIRL